MIPTLFNSGLLGSTSGGGGGIGGWVELGRTTLGSSSDTITVSGLADKRYLMVLGSVNQTGGDWRTFVRLNGDTGSNYSQRYTQNGGADATNTSLNGMLDWNTTNTTSTFEVMYFANYSSKEKLGIKHKVGQSTAGSSTAPIRGEMVGKHAQTSNPISSITLTDAVDPKAGSANTGSEVVVLGWDESDAHTNNFFEELASVDLGAAGDTLDTSSFTSKKYLWVQWYVSNDSGNINPEIRFNSDSGSNYARRKSGDGGADGTVTSASSISVAQTEDPDPRFCNMFIINNQSNEKLGIAHYMEQQSASAANTPQRSETVFKWANTSNQISSIQVINVGTGDFGTNSKIRVWGAD